MNAARKSLSAPLSLVGTIEQTPDWTCGLHRPRFLAPSCVWLAGCQFCFDLTDRDDECLLRRGWCAALRRTKKATHERTSGNHRPLPPFWTIAKQHLSGALKHLSRTAIKEAARRVGLWSRGMLVMDNPD